MAKKPSYKEQARKAKEEGDIDTFHNLIKKELNRRSANILVDKCIMPAYEKIMNA